MKTGQIVKVKKTEEIGTINFVDNQWNLPDGSTADVLCKVSFPRNIHGEWFRISELELSDKKIEKDEKMKQQIEFSQFIEIEKQLEIRLGKITSVERVPKSDKMLKMNVNFGSENRTVMTNIGNQVNPEDLIEKVLPFITNLKPTKIMGVESSAMIMVPTNDEGGSIDLLSSPGSKLL